MRIGIAGLGRMATAMAGRLLDQGHRLTIWNRSPGKTEALAARGARVAASPAQVAAESDVVLTVLTDAAAIASVYDGRDGLFGGDVAGRLFIEMSTVRPQTVIELAEKARAKGAVLVDCPVGGTVGPAREGKLFGFIGGAPEEVARAKPLLADLCRRLEHCGPVGAGALMKLAINLPLIVAWQAYGEAFALCRDLGMPPRRLVDIFADTSGANNAFRARAPKIAAILAGEPSDDVTFTLENALKDARTMVEEGRARGIELPLVERAIVCFEEAIAKGWGAQDGASYPAYWARRADA